MTKTHAHQQADRLLDGLFTLMRKINQGEEVTKHHLLGLHDHTVELLRDLGGFEDLIEKYRV